MVYRNKITGLEIITDCVISAPQFELVESAPKKVIETPPAETSEESLVEDKPKKRRTRAKK